MNREEKNATIAALRDKLNAHNHFYITDSSALTVQEVNDLRRKCFESGIELKVVKNTLVKKAMEASETDYAALFDVLKGPTSLMFTQKSNAPAKVITAFRKAHDKPILKAAYIDTDVFIGDEQLKTLADLKSKEELIGEVITLLQSPIKNVVSALNSSEQKIAGLVKTLSERKEDAAEVKAEDKTEAAEAKTETTERKEEKQEKVNPEASAEEENKEGEDTPENKADTTEGTTDKESGKEESK